jgi:YidC/Oxa1 family membrane protein insertase
LNKLSRGIIFCLIFILPPSAIQAGPKDPVQGRFAARIHTQWVDVAWIAGQPEPVMWRVLASPDPADTEWFCLQAPAADPSSQPGHFRLQGALADIPIASTGNWKLVDNKAHPQTVVYRRELHDGLILEQLYTVSDHPYRFRLTIKLTNSGSAVFSPRKNDRLQFTLGPGLGDQRSDGLGYAEAMYSFIEPVALIDDKIERFRSKRTEPFTLPWATGNLLWVGLHGRYFALLAAPLFDPGDKEGSGVEKLSVHLEKDDNIELPLNHLPVLSIQVPVYPVAPGAHEQWAFSIYSGPKSTQWLREGTPEFDKLVFPGLWSWMRWLCFGLLWLMTTMHAVVPNWGAVIILLAVLVRMAMYPIARRALESQKRFAKVQKRIGPELQLIKREFRGEEQSERILHLYEQQGISPLAGLKPLLIVLLQLPILIALFHVLGTAYELRGAPFLWITTLAEPDKLFALGFPAPLLGGYFNVLPVLMALSTLAALKLSPAPVAGRAAQRRQKAFLVILAVGFFVLFYPFPSGMVLYWTTANLLHIAQQKLM